MASMTSRTSMSSTVSTASTASTASAPAMTSTTVTNTTKIETDTKLTSPITIVEYTKRPKVVQRRLQSFLDSILQHHKASELAAVIDIDETLLLVEDEEQSEQTEQTEQSVKMTTHPLGYHIFQMLQQRQVEVVLVTARHGTQPTKEYTLEQLRRLGYTGPSKLYMVNQRHADDVSPAVFKRQARLRVMQRKRLLLNVGDQMSDMTGNYDSISSTELAKMISPTTYYFLNVPGDALLSLKLPSKSPYD